RESLDNRVPVSETVQSGRISLAYKVQGVGDRGNTRFELECPDWSRPERCGDMVQCLILYFSNYLRVLLLTCPPHGTGVRESGSTHVLYNVRKCSCDNPFTVLASIRELFTLEHALSAKLRTCSSRVRLRSKSTPSHLRVDPASTMTSVPSSFPSRNTGDSPRRVATSGASPPSCRAPPTFLLGAAISAQTQRGGSVEMYSLSVTWMTAVFYRRRRRI
ncbi:hypothetical protein B0H10DRAFT_2261117, partial [Mycena sp. CBHHK59/15]